MPPPHRPRTTLQQRALSAVSTRLPLKFTAVAFAVILWAIVSVEEPSEAFIDVLLQPLPNDSSIVVRRPLPRVQALVVGRARDVFRLAAQPPVIRTPITADAPETLTVRLSPEIVELPSGINARVRDVLPASITLHLDVLAEKVVPVASVFSLEHDTDFTISGPVVLDPDSVTIAGPRALVEELDSVYTRRTVVHVSDSLPRLVPLDTARLGVYVRPARVSIRVPLVRRDTLSDSLRDTVRP